MSALIRIKGERIGSPLQQDQGRTHRFAPTGSINGGMNDQKA